MPERTWPEWYDRAAIWIIDCFFSGKFNSLFSFLFGLGFTIQMERLARRGAGWQWIYARRLAILLLFGVAHAILVWSGDVLHIYAVLGGLLLGLRRLPDKALLTITAFLILLPTFTSTYFVSRHTPERAREQRARIERMNAAEVKALGSGTYADAVRIRMDTEREMYSRPFLLFFYASLTITMLLGFYAGRRRIAQEPHSHAVLIRRVQWWSLAIGLTTAGTFAVGVRFIEPFKPTALNILLSTLYAFARPSLMLFYATSLLRIANSDRWRALVAPLAFTGRMPLTNYLMQSVVCTLLFYNYGLGLFQKVGPALQLGVAFALFGLQVLWSIAWFRHFRFGPAEWLWRALTYGRAPEMRRRERGLAAAAGA